MLSRRLTVPAAKHLRIPRLKGLRLCLGRGGGHVRCEGVRNRNQSCRQARGPERPAGERSPGRPGGRSPRRLSRLRSRRLDRAGPRRGRASATLAPLRQRAAVDRQFGPAVVGHNQGCVAAYKPLKRQSKAPASESPVVLSRLAGRAAPSGWPAAPGCPSRGSRSRYTPNPRRAACGSERFPSSHPETHAPAPTR